VEKGKQHESNRGRSLAGEPEKEGEGEEEEE